MYIEFDGHHSGGSSFDMYMIFGFCYKMWAIPIGTRSALKKKKKSQYMVSHPELYSDPPIGSDWESGCDTAGVCRPPLRWLSQFISYDRKEFNCL